MKNLFEEKGKRDLRVRREVGREKCGWVGGGKKLKREVRIYSFFLLMLFRSPPCSFFSLLSIFFIRASCFRFLKKKQPFNTEKERERKKKEKGSVKKHGLFFFFFFFPLFFVTWLILPVVICLSQGLSHACLSVNKSTL